MADQDNPVAINPMPSRKRDGWVMAIPNWISAFAALGALGVAAMLTGPLNSMEAYFQSEIALRNTDLLEEREGRVGAERELARMRQQLSRELAVASEQRIVGERLTVRSREHSGEAIFGAQYALYVAGVSAVREGDVSLSQYFRVGHDLLAAARGVAASTELQASRAEVEAVLTMLDRDCPAGTSIALTTPSELRDALSAYSDANQRAFSAYNDCLTAALASTADE